MSTFHHQSSKQALNLEAPRQQAPVRTRPAAVPRLRGFSGAEPLEEDGADDRIRVVSQRQLNRLVFVAAEAGARLASDGSRHDPASWMYAPLALFGGRSPLDACCERDAFLRAMLLLGVCPALDMEPADMDDLVDDDLETPSQTGPDQPASSAVSSCGTLASLADFDLGRPELYTASIVLEGPFETTHAFAAFIAFDEEDATRRLEARLGDAAGRAVLARGFDPSEPVAMSLLSEAMASVLVDVGADANSSLADGLDVFVEHRFAA